MRGTWGVGVSWGLTIEHIRQKLWSLVINKDEKASTVEKTNIEIVSHEKRLPLKLW